MPVCVLTSQISLMPIKFYMSMACLDLPLKDTEEWKGLESDYITENTSVVACKLPQGCWSLKFHHQFNNSAGRFIKLVSV